MTPVPPVSATSSLPVSTPPAPPPKSSGTTTDSDSDTTESTGAAPKDSGKTSGINVLV